MRRTQDRSALTISEVPADWQKLMISQRTMRPAIALANEQLDTRFVASSRPNQPH